MLVFLDACCMIYAVESSSAAGNAVRSAILAQPAGTAFAITELVRFECLVQPLRNQDTAALKEYERFFESCTFLALERREYDAAADLRARHRLMALDALHLAAAATHGCAEFWTNDQSLLALGRVMGTVLRKLP